MGGNRVRLRGFSENDLDDFVRWHTCERNRRFKWDGTLDVVAAEQAFREIQLQSVRGEPTYQLIERCQDRVPVGQVGLFPGDDVSSPALAYLIDHQFWGNGYATEAAGLIIDSYREKHPQALIIAQIPDGHRASERVAEKLGLVPGRTSARSGMIVRQWEMQKETANH